MVGLGVGALGVGQGLLGGCRELDPDAVFLQLCPRIKPRQRTLA